MYCFVLLAPKLQHYLAFLIIPVMEIEITFYNDRRQR